jgi:hypothetical protein
MNGKGFAYQFADGKKAWSEREEFGLLPNFAFPTITKPPFLLLLLVATIV